MAHKAKPHRDNYRHKSGHQGHGVNLSFIRLETVAHISK